MISFYRLIFASQIFFIYACLSSVNNCASKPDRSDSVSLDSGYLVQNERFMLGLYGTEEERESAVTELREECNSKEAHACYNLASFLFTQKKFKDSSEFSIRANQLKPEDPLYYELNRQVHLKLEKVLESNSSIVENYSELEIHCKNKNTVKAISNIEKLIELNQITKEVLQTGIIPECIPKNDLDVLIQKSKSNSKDYTKLFYIEKAKNNPFHEIWDVESFLKKNNLETESNLTKSLSKLWKNFKLSVQANSEKKSAENLNLFMSELNKLKLTDKKNDKFYLHLKMAASLLIEQDEVYSKMKSLKQVLLNNK